MCRACGKLSCSYLRLAPHYDDPKAADRHRNVQKSHKQTVRQTYIGGDKPSDHSLNNLENNYDSSNGSGHSEKWEAGQRYCIVAIISKQNMSGAFTCTSNGYSILRDASEMHPRYSGCGSTGRLAAHRVQSIGSAITGRLIDWAQLWSGLLYIKSTDDFDPPSKPNCNELCMQVKCEFKFKFESNLILILM